MDAYKSGRNDMTFWARWLLVFALITVISTVSQAEAGLKRDPVAPQIESQQPRFALLIGNNAYPGARLKNPVSDARLVGHVLQQIGFDVTIATDVGLEEFQRVLNQFNNRISSSENAVVVFYFSGQGGE